MRVLLLLVLGLLVPAPARAAEPIVPLPIPTAPSSNAAPAYPDPSAWTIEQLLEANIQARVHKAREAAARRDILAWGKAVMPESFYKPFCHELHDYFVEIRHDELTATVAPRGHAKTLVKCKLIPMFTALEEPTRYNFYLNIQSTNAKGVNVNFGIKHEFETNPVIRRMYGNMVGTVKWTDETFMLSNGVIFRGAGVGDSIRGMNFLDRRPKYTIVDDLYDDDDLDKPDRIQAKNDWFWGSLYPAREKGRSTCFHVQGTVAGENDLMLLLGVMAKTDEGIKHKEFAAVKPDGTPLWVELNTSAELDKERSRMGEALFDRENQGDRTTRKNSIIKKHMLASWRRPAADFRCDVREDRWQLLDVCVGVDPSVGKKQNPGLNKGKAGDPAGYARVWKLQDRTQPQSLPVYFIDNVHMEQLGMDDRVKMAKEFVSTARPDRRVRRVRVETIAGFDDIGTLIARAVGVPCEKVPSVPDKILNLERKQPIFQNGRIFINENIPLKVIIELENQITNNLPTHDDGRDAVFLCLEDGGPSMQAWVKGTNA